MLVFAAITPHSPLLIPGIGKEKTTILSKTHQALQELGESLYLSKPDCILIISPHTGLFGEAFSVNAHDSFSSNFTMFGDLTTTQTWQGSPAFASRIAHAARNEGMPVRLFSSEEIDHGCAVPLFHLTTHMPHVQVLPIGFSAKNTEEHTAFGTLLREVIEESKMRIAVIASGDLSHVSSRSKKKKSTNDQQNFDEHLISLLSKQDIEGVQKLDRACDGNAEECGYRSILILLGILDTLEYQYHTKCYESPHDVGLLTAEYKIA